MKEVTARIEAVARREGLCSRRGSEVGDQLRSMSDREEEMAKQGQRFDARTEGEARGKMWSTGAGGYGGF